MSQPLEVERLSVPSIQIAENDQGGLLLTFLSALHAHLPEDERPTSWMQFSDDQRRRAEAAWKAMTDAALSPPTEARGMPGREEVAETIQGLKDWLESTRDERHFPAHLLGWADEAEDRLDRILSLISAQPSDQPEKLR